MALELATARTMAFWLGTLAARSVLEAGFVGFIPFSLANLARIPGGQRLRFAALAPFALGVTGYSIWR